MVTINSALHNYSIIALCLLYTYIDGEKGFKWFSHPTTRYTYTLPCVCALLFKLQIVNENVRL